MKHKERTEPVEELKDEALEAVSGGEDRIEALEYEDTIGLGDAEQKASAQ